MNTKLLREIQKSILNEPRRFCMTTFWSESESAPCGTVSCIAGHAIILDALKRHKKTFNHKNFILKTFSDVGYDFIANEAMDLLDITREKADTLFYAEKWPARFWNRYQHEISKYYSNNEALAELAVERIEDFIKENEVKEI